MKNLLKLKTKNVVFLIFNRPDVTRLVFDRIAEAKPQRLFIVADGPRKERPEDKVLCEQTREIVENINWDCEVLRNYSDSNMGLQRRVSSGLDWVFGQSDDAIILEDDCLPDPTFFQYASELLEKYREDHRIISKKYKFIFVRNSLQMSSGLCIYATKKARKLTAT